MTTLSRRGLLGAGLGAGIGAAGVGTGLAAGFALGDDARPAGHTRAGITSHPFHGPHQAGIATPVAGRGKFGKRDVAGYVTAGLSF